MNPVRVEVRRGAVVEAVHRVHAVAVQDGAVIEELGGAAGTLPIPNSFPQSEENQKFNYNFFSTSADGSPPPAGRWTQGTSLDGKGEFSVVQNHPMGEEPVLGPARPDSGAQSQQIG